MSIQSDPVIEAALALSPEERDELANYLLASLSTADSEADPREMESRIEALRRGDAEFLHGDHPAAQM